MQFHSQITLHLVSACAVERIASEASCPIHAISFSNSILAIRISVDEPKTSLIATYYEHNQTLCALYRMSAA
jgi:hypothetical protein